MKVTKTTLFILLILSSLPYFAQVTISRQVIGSTGGYQIGTNISLSSTVGEPAIQTLFSVSTILTQGFQQPQLTTDSLVVAEIINESCRGAKNGSIFIKNVLGCPGPYTLVIKSVTDTSTILGADTLSTGNYIVSITGVNGCFYTTNIFVGIDSDQDCKIKFYSGFTPNGDGNNDNWLIDNIELFPDNEITIFNRWGDKVRSIAKYDNVKHVWMGENDNGNDLPDGTYFYVGKVNKKVYRGWVELTR